MSDIYEVVDCRGLERAEYILRNGRALNIYGAKKVIESQQSDINRLTKQNKLLREALSLVEEKLPVYQNIQGGGYAITLSIDDVNIIKESLKISEL